VFQTHNELYGPKFYVDNLPKTFLEKMLNKSIWNKINFKALATADERST